MPPLVWPILTPNQYRSKASQFRIQPEDCFLFKTWRATRQEA
jgi:hypothetical protein